MEFARNQESSIAQTVTQVFRAMSRNPLVIGIALGLLVNITSIPVPGPLTKGIDLIADAALPAALFSLGGILVQYRPEGDLKTILMVCTLSLIVQPAIMFGMAIAFSLDQASMRSAVLTAAMAPGVNAYVFANMYGVAKRVAATSVLLATAMSVFTVWVWLLILP